LLHILRNYLRKFCNCIYFLAALSYLSPAPRGITRPGEVQKKASSEKVAALLVQVVIKSEQVRAKEKATWCPT
jgi:hypothetical protein